MTTVPLIIRGRVIEDDLVAYPDRHGGGFSTPDVRRYLDQLVLSDPSALNDLYDLSLDEIFDFLEALGARLPMSRNPYLAEAFEVSLSASGLTEPILRHFYETGLERMLKRDNLAEIVERNIGRRYLDGWVAEPLLSGSLGAVRAFGARGLHIVPGNAPLAAGVTVIRCAVTRSDAIVKSPSNDPMTHAAVIRTMVDLDPDHPVTRHFAVGYWKGGDTEIETALYSPRNIEKIVAWGGFDSIKHIASYLQPGIDLITLDPKLSSTIIGREAFDSEAVLRDVAYRTALDIGVANQEGCCSARVIHVECGTDAAGLARAETLGEYVYDALVGLPPHVSTRPRQIDRELAEELRALRLDDSFYRVIGGEDNEGAIIVSKLDEPVDFARLLAGRVANIVPIDDVETAIRRVNAYTQTIGIFPEALKLRIRDRLSLHGAQRIVSLGFAAGTMLVLPQDGIEPLRRMCRWITDETCSLETVDHAFVD